MASLQARHSRSCAIGRSWTTPDETGCTCARGPLYHVVVRAGKRTDRTPVGHNLRNAKRALARITVDVDDGSYEKVLTVKFAAHADGWLASLECKETTKDSYASTITKAKEAFGDKNVRQLRVSDITELNKTMTAEKLTASTRAKHLRVLHACLAAAVVEKKAARNVVRELSRQQKPKVVRKESAYFENDELPVLFAHIPETTADVPNVYRPLFLTALKTGMRQGELLALAWGDVETRAAVVHVRHSYTDGYLSDPKNHERRDVHLDDDVVKLLGAWWGACGKPGDDQLVFPAPTGGYLWTTTILKRELYPAMVAAGVPRVGPTGEKRTFHSFRHTFAKTALEKGQPMTWLSKHLGHSSLMVTAKVYSHWESGEMKRQARKMKGAFSV